MRSLFVVDPLPGLDPGIDATVGLMAATQELGDEVWWCLPEELTCSGGRVHATARQIRLGPRRRGRDHRWIVDACW